MGQHIPIALKEIKKTKCDYLIFEHNFLGFFFYLIDSKCRGYFAEIGRVIINIWCTVMKVVLFWELFISKYIKKSNKSVFDKHSSINIVVLRFGENHCQCRLAIVILATLFRRLPILEDVLNFVVFNGFLKQYNHNQAKVA